MSNHLVNKALLRPIEPGVPVADGTEDSDFLWWVGARPSPRNSGWMSPAQLLPQQGRRHE
jgi:hypothetical protein